MTCASGCDSYEDLCDNTAGCTWDTSDSLCGSADGANEPDCCITDTPSPTTASPTSQPTCASDCYDQDEDCCEADSECVWSTLDICAEGGPGCCSDITTATPTTASPTTDSPTTAEPTTDSPTTDSPTTAEPTGDPTTDSPTTDSPTTAEPTADPTEADTPSPTTDDSTPSPTTESPTSDDSTPTPTTASPTSEAVYPTPKPTMRSAEKWTMLHPHYSGSDGELLWNVYYGEFSDDERFDDFREQQMWDAEVIRPVLVADAKFERYLAVEAVHPPRASSSNGHVWVWVVMASAVLIGALVYWFKFKSGDSKLLNQTETKALLDRTREKEVYVY